ncbi:YeeE/YedE family protein [Jiulongibacter sediminis]|uniref:Transmembrane protein n=1 Tax=Jiulongibacter sediminis TaxID=1605367 RepID=A0A0N8HA74_9BACT|nr:YeeE/YedE thiosulfate transporter family protein [Jiulongibacter sediminis]KPM49380.1 transmembrane protein [Jiulongibacter sediminis]TBX26429.1 transmembrane protein [Jiulongibacter sediminis]
MLENILKPWPWYVAGPVIGLTIPLLLILGNKTFGISNSMRHFCAAVIPGKVPFFQYDWKKEQWIFFFASGIIIGAFVAVNFLSNGADVDLNPQTIAELKALGVNNFNGLLPSDIFTLSELFSLKGFFFIILGGFLVGFGTRYAGGCTSGHAIMGLSNLQWPSLVATVCFMIGGFMMTHLFFPFIFKLF